MKGVIYEMEELDFWKKRVYEKLQEYALKIPKYKSQREVYLDLIHQTITSYKPSPYGNGIKWSKEEKELFKNLSLEEQRKMIVKKSELKSVLFPYVNVDYKAYEYTQRSKESGVESFKKAKELLKKYKNEHFSNIDKKSSDDILHFLRLAYLSGNLEAGVNLAKLLFERAQLSAYEGAINDIKESARITKDLLNYNIPENAYHYYALYKWTRDLNRFYHRELKASILGLHNEEAKACYNYALECVVWEAIDEEAQRIDFERTPYSAELYLAAAIKYQSPLAFLLAAQNYAPSGLTREVLAYALIPYNACLRCSIALGNSEALDTLITNYKNGLKMMRKNVLQANLLESYKSKRKLINGLDPFFDENFKPELIIDYSSAFISMSYGGTIVYPGISRLIQRGDIKDPRDKDSTLESIKEYYLKVWQMTISLFKMLDFVPPESNIFGYLTAQIYSKLSYGYPSARPYIFPKEVLDLKIDFTKELEGYGVDPNEKKDLKE